MNLKSVERSLLRLLSIGICGGLIFSFSSCEKVEIDTQPPKIILIQPGDGDAFTLGNDFLVVTVMHDYVALASYRYKVSWYDDPSNVSVNPGDAAFELDKSAIIPTNDGAPHCEDITFRIDIPAGIRQGYYNLDISCYDKAGNIDEINVRLLFQD